MNAFAKATRIFLVTLLGGLWLAGCGERISMDLGREDEDPVYRRAKDLLDRGMENEALENYLKLIQKRNGNAAESHLDAGNIYLDHLRDPISAIYHFKRAKGLLARSQAPDAQLKLSLIDDLIRTATKAFAASFDAKAYQDPLERLKLLDTIQSLREENNQLKRDLTSSRERLSSANALADATRASEAIVQSAPRSEIVTPTTRPVQVRTAPVETAQPRRTYTIRPGDTLYKISKQVYGDAARWRELLDANKEQIPDASNLRVGTTIVVP